MLSVLRAVGFDVPLAEYIGVIPTQVAHGLGVDYALPMVFEGALTRIKRLPPTAADAVLGIALTALTWLQIQGFSKMWRLFGPPGGRPRQGDEGLFRAPSELIELGERVDHGVWPFVVVALVFLPLAFRRRWPTFVLVVVSGAAVAYLTQPWPPTFVVLAPMIALATVASRASRGRTVLYVLLVGALIGLGPALIYSDARWVAQAVGILGLLIASALFGDAMRSRREYVEEVEQRLQESERTREEEALRRVDEERIRIAREVHDIIAHGLSVVTVQAQAGLSTLESDTAQTRTSLQTIRDTGKDALTELRSMLDVLRTGETDAPRDPSAGLADLEDLAETVRETGIAVDVALEGEAAHLPEFIGLSAYRIVQEALTNVMRHSRASRAEVVVRIGPTDLFVEVIDDGRGSVAAGSEPGHGIEGLRERAEALGGTFRAGPRDSGGFRVVVTIPLPRSTR
jgi:signal transduction histidine kinase